MKQLRQLLTLLVVSICAVQSAWADRSAPQLPEAVAPESGQSYYLYNVQEKKFLCRSTTSNSYLALGAYGEKLTITATANAGEYTIKWASNNYSFQAYDSYLTGYGTGISNNSYFIVSEASNGYTIQRSSQNQYYKADEFVGYDGSNGDRLTPALAEGSIYWKFLPADEAEYYIAKLKLYTYLNIADQYNFYVTQYDLVYNNAASTTAELNQAYETLYDAVTVSSNYVSPSWTEYPILFQNITTNKWENSSGQIRWYCLTNGTVQTSKLKATVNVDDDATLVYNYYVYNNHFSLRVFLDGVLVQTVSANQSYSNNRRYYVELTAGKHDVVWEVVCNDSGSGYGFSSYLSEIGVVNTPTLYPATTTVEGQLGTEMLKLIDPISKTKKVVIKGVIGDDDWTTIGLMVNAFSIDMSGATAEKVPASQFTKEKYPFLHDVKLPQGIKSIGERAFYGSDVENEITFPNTLETIGGNAFYQSKVKAAHMTDNSVTSVGGYAFYQCRFLENVTWSSAAATIPLSCFNECYNLRTFEIPEGVTAVGSYAFQNAYLFNAQLPSSMTSVNLKAFENTATERLVIGENTTVYHAAFDNCPNLVYAEWPTSFANATRFGYSDGTNGVTINCSKLKDVYLKSPTKVTYDEQRFFYGCDLSQITLHVPSYLVSTYKLDPYWYQCNVVGFDESEIADWYVKNPLTLNSERISGTPNLHVSSNGRIEVNGDTPQTIGDLSINLNSYEFWDSNLGGSIYPFWGMMLSTTNKVSITGELSENIYTEGNTWYFITLPFDAKVGDITNSRNAAFAIRYYDGASRAELGTGSNWKNYTATDIIPAGTGFIYQTNKATISKFVSQDNASKQYILSAKEFVKSLAENPSEVTANKGWNLVGNPWQTYYNIHKLNFTAPITVWNTSNSNYEAYSIIDDDYAIQPLQAFFVQCPDEINSISFPIDGRQLTSTIESQSGSRNFDLRRASAQSERKLIDIELTNGELKDKTRLVLNPEAKMDYETRCDASKFFSMNAEVPQIYTLLGGTAMAINERPAADGIVKIGVQIAAAGTYTIQSERNELQDAVLVDTEKGIATNLSTGSYTFSADAGIYESRFELRLSAGDATGIADVKKTANAENKEFFNLNGQRVEAPQKGIYVVNGKKVIVK